MLRPRVEMVWMILKVECVLSGVDSEYHGDIVDKVEPK